MNQKSKLSFAILSTLGLTLGASSFSAQAIEAGDMFMRFTATSVQPNDDSTGFTGASVLSPEVDSNTQLGLTFVYMLENNIGIEVLAATPFSHDISVAPLGVVAETKQLPPTVSVQYYFNPETNIRPYVGVGLNYTTFFQGKTDGLGDIELDDSFGLAVQAGIDYDINDKWFLNADIRYINIETTAEVDAVGSSDVDINPTVISIGAGFKF